MNREQLKELWYYIIRTDDWDRYLWEVYANDELIFIASTEEEAEEKFRKITEFIQNKNQ